MMKKLILTCFTLSVILSCTSESRYARVQNFYFEFIGFDKTDELRELLVLVNDEYKFNDYLITAGDELIAFPREEKILQDSLHSFHPVIHRIEPILTIDDLQEGDILLRVEAIVEDNDGLPSFSYKRYEINSEKLPELKFDFGEHPLHGVRRNDLLLKWAYIAEEFARASFK